ncbi:MAG: 2-C-methyl-D-erythritol 2,4-cyclodiphosphate synthase [Bifidobacteriaceae bacterium]|jgi:2-C-methyl-D-erythritol 2,4-cyclodiphosphate synthase|nr:2-C-methyl-D-erythritol 2,4-cyclodiphosphate synthase [Bifidobacteriaceae bacterium]
MNEELDIIKNFNLLNSFNAAINNVDANNNKNLRVGLGYDIHKFSDLSDLSSDFSILNSKSSLNSVNSRCLWLLGLKWSNYPPLEAHSDGDCAIHALVDAILSASNLGDIGSFLGVDKSNCENISGKTVLQRINKLLKKNNIELVNAGVFVLCQKPNISKRRKTAEKLLSEIINAPISVSASTTDGVGEIGQFKAIASLALALVKFL